MNQNEPIILNLYIRDTESRCKNTKNVGNKQIMRVKKIISFYKKQHFFTVLFMHNFLSRWLNESFQFFCVSYVKIQKIGSIWFIIQKSIFYSFLWLIGLPEFWRWHHPLLNFWWSGDRFVWWFRSDVPMTRWWRK